MYNKVALLECFFPMTIFDFYRSISTTRVVVKGKEQMELNSRFGTRVTGTRGCEESGEWLGKKPQCTMERICRLIVLTALANTGYIFKNLPFLRLQSSAHLLGVSEYSGI